MTWPLPDRRDGTVIALVTDRHHGQRFFTESTMDRVADDLIALRSVAHGVVDAGDAINWDDEDPQAEDDLAHDWTNRVKAGTGLPYVWVPGNHDLSSYAFPDVERTALSWAGSVGQPSHLTETTVGDLTILGIGPDNWDQWQGPGDVPATVGPCIIAPATLDWLEDKLTQAGNNPVMIANHAPLWEQYEKEGIGGVRAGVKWFTNPHDQLTDLIDSHPNMVGWLSGHLHVNIDTRATTHARTIMVGSRKIFAVNGPAASGAMEGISSADQQLKSPALTTWITYEGNAIQVRWYDHKNRGWTDANGSYMRRITL